MAVPSSLVPDRWLEYSNFNQCIDKTRILPIKTPLKDSYNTGLPADKLVKMAIQGVPLGKEFTTSDLMRDLAKKDMVLGLVVDLTNTARYYDSTDFVSADVRYEKIRCIGREIPSNDIYERFSKTLTSFLSENDTKIAAIHCTHGINRTGYLVCRYLIEHSNYKPEDAIKVFEHARGYKIERENYLDHLKKGCPQLPNRVNDYTNDRGDPFHQTKYGGDYNDWVSHSRRRSPVWSSPSVRNQSQSEWSGYGNREYSLKRVKDDDYDEDSFSKHRGSYSNHLGSFSNHRHSFSSEHQDSFSNHKDSSSNHRHRISNHWDSHRDSFPNHRDSSSSHHNSFSNHRDSSSNHRDSSSSHHNSFSNHRDSSSIKPSGLKHPQTIGTHPQTIRTHPQTIRTHPQTIRTHPQTIGIRRSSNHFQVMKTHTTVAETRSRINNHTHTK